MKDANPYRKRDTPIAKMLGISVNCWYTRLSAEERKMYRNIWFHTPEQDKQLPPGEWQLKYLGGVFIPPAPKKGPEYLSDGYGNTLTRYPDGTDKITIWREKVTITTRPDGMREIVMKDTGCEWSQIDHPSGKRIHRRSNSRGRWIMQTELPNGIIITEAYDGINEVQYPNGAVILKSPDGSAELRMDGKTIELAPVIPALKDVQKNRRERLQGKEQEEETIFSHAEGRR